MLHGGCWQESIGGTGLMGAIAEDLRQHGIAVWNIEYRREGVDGAGYPGTFLDVADALDYLPKIAIDHGLDLAHVVALGHSAGGQLALWAAARGRFKPGSPLYRKHPQKIQAVISVAGIDDLASYRDTGNPVCGVPGSIDALVSHNGKNSYEDTSPVAMLPLHVPQLVVSGTDDEIVPPHFGADYAAAATKAGDKVEELVIKGADHIDLIDPQSDAWVQIRARLKDYLK
jgi:acetyl esterase/lipase